ncbi:DNA translocase FtsK [Poseidonibacter ostreae]|uniref:DNA translocase FtsK n=1 Tax=Poseidonibacter ostreae TaxID=2654171 RepID=A0A6L4WVH5_9BACT|nr:DNA translocase FtsK [Poseidonibacter ostreae]KAB7886833.1 DNA translocase FtsK [Poseidonibacter ostreae]KAB7890476.1 DNA translocase FtsK [Poseidonibacter ostreae]KAB7890931.1 DNA translocase FtsK [Poseidonibacter ostreae]
MAKKIISLIVLFIIVYFEFATFFSTKDVVGKVGFIFAKNSNEYFGLLSYVYLLMFLYPLYIINFKENIKGKDLTLNIIVVLLILFVSLIFQSLIVENGIYSGKIGNILVESLSPFIGNAGLYIFVLVGFVISFLVLFENSEMDVTKLVNKFKFDRSSNIKRIENTSSKRKKRKEESVVVKESGNTAEITIDNPIITPVAPVETDFINEPEILEVIDEIKENTSKEENNQLEEQILSTQHEAHGIIVEELEENKKLLDEIELGATEKPKDFKLPHTNFFQATPKEKKSKVSESVIDQKICDLLDKLSMFKIEGDVVRTYTGPVVTTFEFKPAPNVKVSKILNLQDDLAMALKAQTIRIQAPIPGKDVVGIEVPNEDTQTIYLKEMLESDLFQNSKSPLTMILGKDIVGKAFITDLKKLPHLLIAGTTGSGKSVGINSMILSLLYKNSPDNLKLVMIDPKMLEFSMYNDIPHLLTPVITKAGDAVNALANMVGEMERRYTLMSQTKTKNIENYNEKAKKEGFETLPYIVVVIDELADLMMTSGKDVEYSIARLAQMARASGIHLIVATQRPSVDVVTGLIKANLPSRLSYKVGQKIDSKIILDSMGAESLLGRGDMLFTPPGMSGLVRIHAPWSSEDEIEKVVDFLKEQRDVEYDMNFIKDRNSQNSSNTSTSAELGELDELYEAAKMVCINDKKTSISYIQRKLRIGYNRAATIVEQLEQTGVLSEANIKGNREILV